MIKLAKSFKKYNFLLMQLVSKDFKIKYKRSFLGVLWSLLYPVFMMLVMYVVFSNVFKFNIPDVNYMAYLLSGLVFFNYFNEATNLSMTSIIYNFSLINKIYMPKYIFPLSKCLSASINFFLSLIPLYLIIIFTGSGATKCNITIYHLALPYSFICLLLFTIGIGFILSSMAVFVRDMIYLYGILVTIWQYLTPIMYDIEMIGGRAQMIFKFNPMYQFMNFARVIILEDRLPSLMNFAACLLSAVVVCLIGILFFKKTQNKFIYYV